MSDRIFSGILILVGVFIILSLNSLDVPFMYEPVGPKAFPIVVSALMILLGFVMLVFPDPDISWPDITVIKMAVLLVITFTFYAIFFEYLGFPLGTAIMAIVTSRVFKGGWKESVISGISIAVLGYLIFDDLLQVSLPLGKIWGMY